MRLALDIGNSRIKWGLRANHQWQDFGSLPTVQWQALKALLDDRGPIAEVWACQVAGAAVASGVAGFCTAAGIPLRWARAVPSAGGVTNHYQDSGQLGADRWAALIGARASSHLPTVVVNAGTATTIDALGSTGEFLGGLILPGLTLMQQALHQGTAALPVASAGNFALFPMNTADAVVSGAIAGTVGAIESMNRNLATRESAEIRILLSGGHATVLRDRLTTPTTLVTYLVLEGLAQLMEGEARDGSAPEGP